MSCIQNRRLPLKRLYCEVGQIKCIVDFFFPLELLLIPEKKKRRRMEEKNRVIVGLRGR